MGRINLKVAGILAGEEPVTAGPCVARAEPAEQAVVADRFNAGQKVVAAPLGGSIAEEVLRGATVSAAAEVVGDLREEDGQGVDLAVGAVVVVAVGGADSGDF